MREHEAPIAPARYELWMSCAAEVVTVALEVGREYTLGRDASCDVPIDDTTVSRLHARLSVRESGVTITDMGSSNGTLVSGRRLAPREAAKLVTGTVAEVGQATVVIAPSRAHGAAQVSAPRARSSSHPPANPSRLVIDPTMRNLYAMLDIVAPSQIAVLILGETGVGKEVFAAEVHRRSRRASAPFIAINCAALPDSILEAELFGYEKGAFTGANQAKVGLFEAADGGTIFLDEIGDMPQTTQAKVLRVLESGEILRLGSVKARTVDVRFVAATNRDLPRMIDAGRFRADLFFRLNGVTVSVPPLRRRRAEIVPLATMFIELAANRHGRVAPVLSADAAAQLADMPWPGNVRQLRSTIERAVVLCTGGILGADHFDDGSDVGMTPCPPVPVDGDGSTQRMHRRELLSRTPSFDDEAARTAETHTITMPAPAPLPSFEQRSDPSHRPPRDLPGELKALERERIIDALSRCGGNQSQAARILGMSRTTLIARVREFSLARPRQVLPTP
ncbi:MAG: uncharacterized protein JWP87_6455 [Labilithrix sp.]|nr:uncharacterized protein [Labilithrix sp.]